MRRTVVAVLFVLFVAAPGAAIAQQAGADAVREALEALARDFDRTRLEPDIIVRGADGQAARGVRCATRTPGEFERALVNGALASYVAERGTAHRARTLEIPVVFHVVRAGRRFDVSDARVGRQMDVLNAAYVGHGYRFRLDEIRRYDDRQFARKCLRERVEERFKERNAVSPTTTLNIYTCRPAQETLGYAYLPTDLREDSPLHGVVVHHGTLPGGGLAPFNEGDTLTHEVGHYLGLFHTFDGGCRDGDRVADTPAERDAAYGCPVGRDSCPNAPGLDPIYNYMDYADDSCMDEFTAGQEARMDDQTARFRASLGSAAGVQ